jgi:hypothetical protein
MSLTHQQKLAKLSWVTKIQKKNKIGGPKCQLLMRVVATT